MSIEQTIRDNPTKTSTEIRDIYNNKCHPSGVHVVSKRDIPTWLEQEAGFSTADSIDLRNRILGMLELFAEGNINYGIEPVPTAADELLGLDNGGTVDIGLPLTRFMLQSFVISVEGALTQDEVDQIILPTCEYPPVTESDVQTVLGRLAREEEAKEVLEIIQKNIQHETSIINNDAASERHQVAQYVSGEVEDLIVVVDKTL